jgi:hypothetical protein
MIISHYLQEILREAVRDQIEEWKDRWYSNGTVYCEITRLPIERMQCEADHFPESFGDLAYRFLSGRRYDLVTYSEGNWAIHPKLLREWRAFHKKNASLRPTYHAANKRRKKSHKSWRKLFTKRAKLVKTSAEADELFGKGAFADKERPSDRRDAVLRKIPCVAEPTYRDALSRGDTAQLSGFSVSSRDLSRLTGLSERQISYLLIPLLDVHVASWRFKRGRTREWHYCRLLLGRDGA